MAGIVSIVVGFAAPVALSAMACGSYLQGVFPAVSAKVLSAVVVVVVTMFHLRDLRVSSIFQIVFTVLKISLVIFLSVALLGSPDTSSQTDAAWGHYVLSAPFAVALMFTLYAYSGWNAATYILDEVRTPARDVPRALAGGTLTVMALYLALNYAFLHAATVEAMAGQINVAQIAAAVAFGSLGGKLVAVIIALGLVSAISAMIWAGPRVGLALGEDYPRAFGWLTQRNAAGIPVRAVLAQSTLTLLLLSTSSFEQILVYTQFALLACSFLTVLGVIALRRTQPNLPRPFRIPLYPLPPVLFLAISAFAMIYTATVKPMEALLGSLTLLGALAIYSAVARGKNAPTK